MVASKNLKPAQTSSCMALGCWQVPAYLDNKVGGRCTLSITDKRGLQREPLGFAQAKTEVLALRDAIIPAFAIETVCCSITWKIEVQSSTVVNFHRMYKKKIMKYRKHFKS